MKYKFRNIIIGLLLTVGTNSYTKEIDVLTEPNKMVSNLLIQYKLENVDFEYVNKAINKGNRNSVKAILIDTRAELKYKRGTIPTSLNIPDSKFEENYSVLNNISKEKELIVYCEGYNCSKSVIIAQKLKEKGHSNVKVYLAGELQWNQYSYLEIDTSTVKLYQERNLALFIDARIHSKYLEETISGSISIPDSNINKLIGRLPIDKKENIVIFCEDYNDNKAHIIANKLISLDYENVTVYSGGLLLWKESGLDTVVSTKANLEEKKEKSFRKEKYDKNKIKDKKLESNINDVWYKQN